MTAKPSGKNRPALLGSRRRRVTLVAGSMGGGLVAALSVPPFGFWPLAFVGSAVLYLSMRNGTFRRRLVAGTAFAVGFFGLGYAWIAQLVAGGWIASVAFESALTGLACAATSPLTGPHRMPRTPGTPGPPGPPGTPGTPGTPGEGGRVGPWKGLGSPALFAAVLVTADAFRWWWPFGGMPIGSMALGQAAAPLGQLARTGGPLLVEGAVFLLGAALGEAALVVYGRLSDPPMAGGGTNRPALGATLGAALVLVAAVGAATAVSTGPAPDGGTPIGSLSVAAVQGGGVRGLHALFTDAAAVFDRQLERTRSIPATAHTDLVVWPEDVVALSAPLTGSSEGSDLAAAAHRLRATLVAGVTETVGATLFRNEVVAWSPSGSLVGRYEKVHRVPFGEYIPFRSFFSHLGPTSLVPRDAIGGHGSGVLTTPAGSLGIMISFEVFFPARAAAPVSHGARLLVVPTNDASYSTGQVPAQEVAADRLRAIEQGRDLVQAAPTGYTGVVDNRGSLLARSALGVGTVVENRVALRQGRTWYSDVGDAPVIAAASLVLVLGWLAEVARRRRRAMVSR